LRPLSWYDIPAETLVRDPQWRRTADIVLRELQYVLLQQHRRPAQVLFEVHPAYLIDLAKRINAYQEN
jgi:hypothetical protein